MKNNNTIELGINDAIALCHIIDNFEEFDKNLINLLATSTKSKDINNTIYKLEEISRKKYCFNSKLRKFYSDNKKEIDTINQYSSINYFIFNNYLNEKNINAINYLFDYILRNKTKLDKIILVLEKIKKLGFATFNFNENLDFTTDIYEMHIKSYYAYIVYLDNLIIVPNYKQNIVKYQTKASNYKINLAIHDYTTIRGKKILLNSLSFDVENLPKSLTLKETINKIIALKNEHKIENSIVSNSVNLSIGIEDLSIMVNSVDKVISNSENIDKKDLITSLANIKNELLKMKTTIENYEKDAINNTTTITQELLDEEKNQYKRIRSLSHIDYC